MFDFNIAILYNAITMKNFFFKKWKKAALEFANFQIKILLFLVYFIIILPYRLGLGIKGIFAKKNSPSSGCWVDLKEKNDSIDSLRRQY